MKVLLVRREGRPARVRRMTARLSTSGIAITATGSAMGSRGAAGSGRMADRPARESGWPRGQQQPEEHRPGVPRRSAQGVVVGKKLVIPTSRTLTSVTRVARSRLTHAEQVRVSEESPGSHQHDSGGKPVQAVHEVDGIDADHDDQHGEQHAGQRVENQNFPTGNQMIAIP